MGLVRLPQYKCTALLGVYREVTILIWTKFGCNLLNVEHYSAPGNAKILQPVWRSCETDVFNGVFGRVPGAS